MQCPKCKGKEVFFSKANRIVSPNCTVTILKRYTCLKCGHKFDFI